MNYSYKTIARGIELLVLCQTLQCEKDGLTRPLPGTFASIHSADQFGRDISNAVSNFGVLFRTIPYVEQLTAIGKKLEVNGDITVDADGYAHAALKYFTQLCGLEPSPTSSMDLLNRQMQNSHRVASTATIGA